MPLSRTPKQPKAPKPFDPNKAVMAAPRIKPASTREYGKGGTPLSGGGFNGAARGAGIGFGGPTRDV
jgi:hypothetical protein